MFKCSVPCSETTVEVTAKTVTLSQNGERARADEGTYTYWTPRERRE